MVKRYFSYNEIHRTVNKLADTLGKTQWEPDVIVAIGTGGFIPARMLRSYIGKPIYTVGIKYYGEDNKPISEPEKIQWIDEVERKLEGKSVLLVDEVDDSRTTLAYCVKELLRHNLKDISVMVLHNKLREKTAEFPEDLRHYFAGEDLPDEWIIYPWDALDIDDHQTHCEND